MSTSKNKFTFKIILSYVTLAVLALVVGYFLYSEFKFLIYTNSSTEKEEKFIETGTLINQVYETDGFSRLALLTESVADFKTYQQKADSLINKIEQIKSLTAIPYQIEQLDSVKMLLQDKNKNIEQLRILKLTNNKDSSLDDITKEFNKLENSMGKLSVATFVKTPEDLTPRERNFWESYVDYLNQKAQQQDTTTVRTKVVGSMLASTRYIVSEAKRENSKARRVLQQKENELIRNDLNTSAQLRRLITAFDTEVKRNKLIENEQRKASVERTSTILKYAGILGIITILIFTYIILNDFFKAERFKSSLKQAKEFSEDLLKSREQLISTVSHDLKTPLNTIIGYSGLIENTSLSEKQTHYISQITNSSHYITKLVDDLLDFSKLEAGKLAIETVPFSLENIITQTAEASKDIHQKPEVNLIVGLSEAIKQQVFESDPLRIRQIISNLVGNAFKFTETGSVSISTEIIEDTKTETRLKIHVIDTGIGISKEQQDIVFKEFQQASEDTLKKFGGNGLGLAISRKLTNLLGGTLTLESELGKGSTFTLALLLKKSSSKLKSPQYKFVKAVKPMTVVVIDDDTSMAKLLKELFEQLDITCKSYTDFDQFSEQADYHYDLVLTDIEMPNTNGFKVLEQLKRHNSAGYKKQPIVAMTGSRDYTLKSFKELGFSGLLQKPFPKEMLFSLLQQLFPDKMGSSIKTELQTEPELKPGKHFDLSLLNSFLGTDDALEEVLISFYSEVGNDLKRLQAAVAAKNYVAVNDIAHKMLTLNRQIKATRVVKTLDTLEYATVENTSHNLLDDLYQTLKVDVESLIEALKNRRK